MKIIGIVPARMAASRFPGKPLYLICGRPMLEHVFRRAQKFPSWTALAIATCDTEIQQFGDRQGWTTIMTSSCHTRCLDRVAEAAEKCGQSLCDTDIVVCVQGDEPMLHPDMITACVSPMQLDPEVNATALAVEIIDDEQFRNPDIVKIIYNKNNDVIYTSRAPVPYYNKTRGPYVARRMGGIYAFRWALLQTFTRLPESPLEQGESCDSNRLLDNGIFQRIAPYPYRPFFSVDSPHDIAQVEANMAADPLWGQY